MHPSATAAHGSTSRCPFHQIAERTRQLVCATFDLRQLDGVAEKASVGATLAAFRRGDFTQLLDTILSAGEDPADAEKMEGGHPLIRQIEASKVMISSLFAIVIEGAIFPRFNMISRSAKETGLVDFEDGVRKEVTVNHLLSLQPDQILEKFIQCQFGMFERALKAWEDEPCAFTNFSIPFRAARLLDMIVIDGMHTEGIYTPFRGYLRVLFSGFATGLYTTMGLFEVAPRILSREGLSIDSQSIEGVVRNSYVPLLLHLASGHRDVIFPAIDAIRKPSLWHYDSDCLFYDAENKKIAPKAEQLVRHFEKQAASDAPILDAQVGCSFLFTGLFRSFFEFNLNLARRFYFPRM